MKSVFFMLVLCLSLLSRAQAATDLITVFQQALVADPTYQQAIADALSNQENINLSRAAFMPQINFAARPFYDKQHNSGAMSNFILPRNNTLRIFDMQLKLTQTIFNFAQFSKLASAKAAAKEANASLNAALQNLMIRVAKAYFTVLQDEENLAYEQANEKALKSQLTEIQFKFKAGTKTKIDVSTAKSAYDSAVSRLLSAATQLAIDKEFLHTITANVYDKLVPLKSNFPIISPDPDDIERWVSTALRQNWSIKAREFSVQSARENQRVQMAGHLPTLDAQVYYDTQSFYASNGSGIIAAGSSRLTNGIMFLNLNVPIFSGGSVITETNKAKYGLTKAEQQLEAEIRDTIFMTKKNYLLLKFDREKMRDDQSAIHSAKNTLGFLKARYFLGTENIVSLINQHEKLVQAQAQYAKDRYAYIIHLLTLKQAAGTLSVQDLEAINCWLKL